MKPSNLFKPVSIRRADMSVDLTASPFGCCNFFDHCSDGNAMSLHFSGGLPLLDWMNFQVSEICEKSFEFITYVRPSRIEGAASAGHLADPCADPNGVDWGYAKLTLRDFGRYGRRGPTRDLMRPAKFCESDPIRRLNGTIVTDEREWDSFFATSVIVQDVSRDVITGNAATKGKFNGLERWVKTGYSNPALDSIVVDWNGNPVAGGNGITWNGAAIANTFSFVDILRSAVRRVKQRISWSPMLKMQTMADGDMILVMPSHVATCLLDFYTCWSVCPTTENIVVQLQSYEARAFRNTLNGGLYNAGKITIDGTAISIMAYDWGLIKSATLSDAYLLVGSVGAVQTWFGEHLKADQAAKANATQGYFATDGGRILGKYDTDNECAQLKEWMHPRIYTRAPWLQVRFKDIMCVDAIDPLSPDPESSFFITDDFTGANCSSFDFATIE